MGHLQVIVVCGSHTDEYSAISRSDVLNAQPMQRGVLCDLVGDHQTRRQRGVVHNLTPPPLQQLSQDERRR